jgi:hypothetical protein
MPRLSTPRMVPIAERDVLAGNEGAGRREHADQPARAFGAPQTTCTGFGAVAGIDHADAQPIGIGMLLGLDHPRDRERRSAFALSSICSTSSPIMVESLSASSSERCVGVEMIRHPSEARRG